MGDLEIVKKKTTSSNQFLISGVLVSFGASICCLGPFALLVTGISGAWISQLMVLEPYLPLFVLIVLGLFAVTGWKIFEPVIKTIEKDSCPTPQVKLSQKLTFIFTSVIAGFGRFGQITGRVLTAQGYPFTALEINFGQVDFVREFGDEVYYGDATRLDSSQNAGLRDARLLVIAIGNVEISVKLDETMRESCPGVPILARARDRQHEIKLRDLGVNYVIRESLLSSSDMAKQSLAALGMEEQAVSRIIHAFKFHRSETLEISGFSDYFSVLICNDA